MIFSHRSQKLCCALWDWENEAHTNVEDSIFSIIHLRGLRSGQWTPFRFQGILQLPGGLQMQRQQHWHRQSAQKNVLLLNTLASINDLTSRSGSWRCFPVASEEMNRLYQRKNITYFSCCTLQSLHYSLWSKCLNSQAQSWLFIPVNLSQMSTYNQVFKFIVFKYPMQLWHDAFISSRNKIKVFRRNEQDGRLESSLVKGCWQISSSTI